ncbi:MAG: SRPBCC domain-containing protein [Bacteroidia bacterium]|nr:SRPBCC domain-containing protein [Bacteroidia bacterium]
MLKKEISISATVDRVWNALTQPEEMRNWYFDISNFEATEGEIFDFVVSFTDEDGEHNFRHLFEILEVVPHERLKHTWEHPGHSAGTSTLTWELVPEEDSTTVVLTHEGAESFLDEGSKYFTEESYTAGWNDILQGLKEYLENGK